jgi:hypothetical protein
MCLLLPAQNRGALLPFCSCAGGTKRPRQQAWRTSRASACWDKRPLAVAPCAVRCTQGWRGAICRSCWCSGQPQSGRAVMARVGSCQELFSSSRAPPPAYLPINEPINCISNNVRGCYCMYSYSKPYDTRVAAHSCASLALCSLCSSLSPPGDWHGSPCCCCCCCCCGGVWIALPQLPVCRPPPPPPPVSQGAQPRST